MRTLTLNNVSGVRSLKTCRMIWIPFSALRLDLQIKGTRDGSITVFFGAVVAGISALSRYKNLYESVVLIQNQASRVIAATLNGAVRYNVNVHAVDPSTNSLEDRFRWWRKHGPFPMDFMPYGIGDAGGTRTNRDGFFWFLLALCILEGTGLGLLVYRAVMKTYF